MDRYLTGAGAGTLFHIIRTLIAPLQRECPVSREHRRESHAAGHVRAASQGVSACVCVRVCFCVFARARACVLVCMCVRACVRECAFGTHAVAGILRDCAGEHAPRQQQRPHIDGRRHRLRRHRPSPLAGPFPLAVHSVLPSPTFTLRSHLHAASPTFSLAVRYV